MAAYPIPKPQYGIYNQNNFSPQTTGQTGLTIDEGKKYFLTFPNAQTTQTEYLDNIGVGGTATFENAVTFNDTVTYNADIEFNQNVIVDGTATVGGNLLCDTTATISGTLTAETGIDISVSGGLTFPDNTTQITAYDDTNAVQNNQNNIFLSPYKQTFQGSNSTINTTAPLQFSNVSSGEYGGLYVDPSPNNDLTLYSNQSNGGLTIRNVNGNSFTVNPQLNNANFFNPIVSTGSITGQSLSASTTGSQAYNIYTNTSGVDYGLVIANTSGNNGSLTLSNNGGTLTTITSTTNGLTILDGLDVAGNIGCQAISCSLLNTNGNTITSGAINAGAISGSSLNTTGNITTASNGLGGTSVFNDTVCNFNSISCGGSITAGSFSTSGGIDVNSSNIIDVNQINGINGNLNTTSNLYVNGVVNVDTINGKTVSVPSLNTAPTYPDNTSKIATTSYVSYAISQIPGVTGYAYLTSPSGGFQTFTTPINFTSSLQYNSNTVATISQLPFYTTDIYISFLPAASNPVIGPITGQVTANFPLLTQTTVRTPYVNSSGSTYIVDFLNVPIGINTNAYSNGVTATYPFNDPLNYPAFGFSFGTTNPWSGPWPENTTDICYGTTNNGTGIQFTIAYIYFGSNYAITFGYPYNLGNYSACTFSFSTLGSIVVY